MSITSRTSAPAAPPRRTPSYPYIGELNPDAPGASWGQTGRRTVLFTATGRGVQIGGLIGKIGEQAAWVEASFDRLPTGTTVTLTQH